MFAIEFTFTAPETVGGVNGPFHSTVSLNGLRFADIYEVDDLYIVERAGFATDPTTREEALRTLHVAAEGYLIHAEDQLVAAVYSDLF